MQHGSDEPDGSRKLAFNKETLHDLEPSDDHAALIRGGDGGYRAELANAALTYPIPIPTSRFEALIEQPGEWEVTATIRARVSVSDNGKLVLRSLVQEFDDPKAA